jgi:outer membrane protein TolC
MRLLVAVNLVFLSLCTSLCLQGCAAPKGEEVKEKVDDHVYKIIDSKWTDEFGVKANYRIDSAKPAPNDISDTNTYFVETTLSLSQAVKYATDHNQIYQLEKDFLYIKALDLRLVRHEFGDLLPFGAADAGYVKDGDDEAVTGGAGLGVTKLLKTGATIGVALTSAWVEVISGNASSGFANIFSAAFEQPLLRGSDPNIVFENLTQSERDLLYQIRSFSRFRKQFVVSTISRYYEVLLTYDASQNAWNNYETLVNVCEHAYKLSAAGRLPQYEFDQAVQDKLIAWDAYLQAEKIYKQTLDSFKIAMAMPTEAKIHLDYNELTVLRDVEMKMPVFSETEAIETALDRRLDFANTLDTVTDAERKVLVAFDSMRPDLRFVMATEQRSNGTSDPITLGNAKDSSFIGFKFDPNLDTVSQENNYRLALIFLEQNQRRYKEKMDTVILDVREVYRDLAEAAQRYKVQSEQLVLAKRRFNNTMDLLQYSRANTRDVLDSQRDLYRAQDAATEAMVNYTIAMLRFYRDVEVMQVRPDGMWQSTLAANAK